MYKYNCRKCPIRNRCIDESPNSPSVKENVRQAFAVRTDTLATWGLLQPNCLLLKAEQERTATASTESLLSRRLRQAREAREEMARSLSPPPDRQPDYLRPVSPPVSLQADSPQSPPKGESDEELADIIRRKDARQEALPQEQQPAVSSATPRWLTISSSGRHIALPVAGELVLGRFDPNFGIPPDVDLGYEDGGAHTISRRHVKIVGMRGRHTIEDMGSRHGVFLNREQVKFGPSRQLQLGDRITLGDVQLLYDAVPSYLLDLAPTANMRHFLTITPTGRRLNIAPPNDIIIGRSDRYVDFVPDVDLSREGELAIRVSRRHAVIVWRDHSPYVEDLGSGFGTRLNGEILLIGRAAPLKPGDHIWLGGCVLAYDAEV